MNVVELVREDAETKARRVGRQRKWQRAEKVCRDMSDHDHDEEESRLIFEARKLARKLGLSLAGIGDRWSRSEPLDLAADGIFSEYAAGVRKESE
ncbi:hypothetical protein ACXYMO_04755 [Arenibacterium sp. CAU 1754]